MCNVILYFFERMSLTYRYEYEPFHTICSLVFLRVLLHYTLTIPPTARYRDDAIPFLPVFGLHTHTHTLQWRQLTAVHYAATSAPLPSPRIAYTAAAERPPPTATNNVTL